MTNQTRPPRSAFLRGSAAIAVAVGIMNVSTYAFTIIAAHRTGPGEYGAFAAVMNVLLVAGVLALALQATAARRIARAPGDVHEVERVILTVGLRSAAGLGVFLLLLSPLVDRVLRLDSLLIAVLMAVTIAPTTLLGAQIGVLQGERRWVPLAVVYLVAGVPRVLIGVAFLAVEPSATAAVAAVAVAAFVPVVVAGITLRRRARPAAEGTRASDDLADHSARALWWETVYNSQALLAFLVISSVDIVLARNTLDLHDAGLYAGGLIMVKAVMFLPQFVVVIAFPAMGTERTGRRALLVSLVLVAFTGTAVTLGVQVLPDLALTFVGGEDFTAINDDLWVFAVLGTVLSLVQLLVYSVLAQQARTSVLLLWAALVPLLWAGLTADSVLQLVTRVLVVDGALLAALLGVSLLRLRGEDAAPDPITAPA